MKKIAVAVAIAASALTVAPVAHAAYSAPAVNGRVQGTTYTGEATGFKAGTQVTFLFYNSEGKLIVKIDATADASGKAIYSINSLTPGSYKVTVMGADAGGKPVSATSSFSIATPNNTSSGNAAAVNNSAIKNKGAIGNTGYGNNNNAGVSNGALGTWNQGGVKGTSYTGASKPASSAAPRSGLAYTGAGDQLGIVLVAGAAVTAAGVTTIAVARRRRNV